MHKIQKYIVFTLIISALILIINTCFKNLYNFKIHGFAQAVESITINMHFRNKPNNYFICFNNFCKIPNKNPNNIDYYQFNDKDKEFSKGIIKKTSIVYQDDDFVNNINNIYINVGYKDYYYNNKDILNFKKSTIKQNSITYSVLTLPIKNNYTSLFNSFCICLMSLFINWQYFILPYLYLFVAGLIFIYYKKDKLLFNKKQVYSAFFVLFLLGTMLRFNNINYFPLWIDEVYAKVVALENFKTVFQDPGNPPLFFLLEKIITIFFGLKNIVLRILPLFFGIMIIPIIFIFYKKYDKTLLLSLLATFLAVFNVIFIYQSQEIKSTSFAMLLTILLAYYFLNYIEKQSKRNLIMYLVISFFAINLHYYLFIYMLGNIVFCFIKFYKLKIKDFYKFLSLNFLVYLTFLPYFLNIQDIALNENFNSWIQPLTLTKLHSILNFYFYNLTCLAFFIFILFLNLFFVVLIRNKKIKNIVLDEKKYQLLKYSIFSILFVFVATSSVSIFIKPILDKRLLLIIYPLLFNLYVVLIVSIIKIKNYSKKSIILKLIYSIIIVLFYFSTTYTTSMRKVFIFDLFMNFIKNDIKSIDKDYKIIGTIENNSSYIKNYAYMSKDIHWQVIDTNKDIQDFELQNYIKEKEKTVIYLRNAQTPNVQNKDVKISTYETNTNNIVKVIYK